jgi:arginase
MMVTSPNNGVATSHRGGEFVKDKTISIVGVPFNGGQTKKGVELAPAHLRKAGLATAVEGLGWKINYDNDVSCDPVSTTEVVGTLRNPKWVGSVCQQLNEVVYSRAKEGEFCLMIGGDHSIAAGSINGILRARPDTCVVWVDAHADINTPESSPSGNLHGMPVSILMGIAKIPGFEWQTSLLRPDRIAYVGLRDLDEGEKVILRQRGIAAYSMSDVDRHGIAWVMDQVMARINPNRDRPIHLSFDVDGLDPSVAPATGTPVPGGLTYREGRYICEFLAQEGVLASMDITEVNPALADLHRGNETTTIALQLAQTALGRTLL